jgi:alternate signal-mediated exported protein
MKKMTKGALVTGLGVALLLGGGGTLAVWNDSAASTPGAIVAGDLDLQAGTAIWKDSKGETVDIASYRVVPGETLTYTQDLGITLVGNKIQAEVTTNGVAKSLGNDVTVTAPVLDNANQTLTQADNGKTVKATTTFTFRDRGLEQKQSGVKETYNLDQVQYVLTQKAPSN